MNRSVLTLSILVVILSLASCNHGSNPEKNETVDTLAQNEAEQKTASENTETATNFDINRIPVSDHELGAFPFFNLPEGLAEQNKPLQRKFDRLFFPINGIMTPFEGKVWKTNITLEPGNTDDWSLPYFEKSYDEAISAAGGVKIFDGEITKEEYDRYHSQASYLGEDGSIGYTSQNIKVYAIHRADGANVFIQLAGYSAGGYINILQEEAKN